MGWFDSVLSLVANIPSNAVLQEKNRKLEAEKADLQAEVASLKDDLRKAKSEMVNLTDEIKKLTHKPDLHETEIKILAYLADSDTLHLHDSMAMNLNLGETRLEYFLEILIERKYISWIGSSTIEGVANKYVLTQEGREYLIKNNLI